MLPTLLVAAAIVVVPAGALVILTRWGVCWGATADERAARMPGDDYFSGGPPTFVGMTRAVSVEASPEIVWPWLAQLGRGAGWYSLDRLDNGGRQSARQIVSWIPPPRIGDASPIGYLRHVVPGSELTWWVPGVRFLGAMARLTVDIRLRPEGGGSRLVIRMSSDATGITARPALWVFRFIDSVMARRQLLGIKERVESCGRRTSDPDRPETGARDQFQLYEVIYASGGRAGTPGKELGERWHRAAVAAGLIPPEGEGASRTDTPEKA
jgi:hypothetical protein